MNNPLNSYLGWHPDFIIAVKNIFSSSQYQPIIKEFNLYALMFLV